MNVFLTIAFSGQCAFLLIWGLLRRGRILEMPFLFGCTLVGFALPQFIGLLSDTALPVDGLMTTLLMANLCTAAFYIGYTRCRRPLRIVNWKFDGSALKFGALILTLIGALFFFMITRLPEEMTERGQWTGLPVAYLFFAQMMTYGFAIAILLWGAFRTRICLLLVVFATIFYLDRIVVAARRGVASEFVLVLLCGIWFTRRKCPSRWAMILFLFVAILFVNSAKDIRNATMQGAAFGSIFKGDDPFASNELAKIHYFENLEGVADEGGAEVRLAVYTIAACGKTERYDWGAFQWNRLVFKYVPAQLFGEDFKNSLLAKDNDFSYGVFAYKAKTGTTQTGFADAYCSFWYLGCLSFFMIGYVMALLYRAAMQGHLIGMVSYMIMSTNALHTITHGTDWFFSAWPHMILFLMPVLLLSRIRPVPFCLNTPNSFLLAEPANLP